MIGIYFSGTGNSKYCIEKFLSEYNVEAKAVSIEEKTIFQQIKEQEEIIFSYPVQYSNIPKIVKDFIANHPTLWKKKQIFIIATMGLFSGDGAGILARLLKKYGAIITGGLHLKMPDSICDEKALKRPLEINKNLISNAEIKIKKAVQAYQNGTPTQEGIGFLYHLAGLFGQRLYFINKTKHYTNKLNINSNTCIGCGKCVRLCPMKNITIKSGIAIPNNQCTMCYRCINNCPKQSITLLGKRVIEQGTISKYI